MPPRTSYNTLITLLLPITLSYTCTPAHSSIQDYNVGAVIDGFVNRVMDQVKHYPQGNQDATADTLFMLGCDFQYERAATFFANTDRRECDAGNTRSLAAAAVAALGPRPLSCELLLLLLPAVVIVFVRSRPTVHSSSTRSGPLAEPGRPCECVLLHPRRLRRGQARVRQDVHAQDGRPLPLRGQPARILVREGVRAVVRENACRTKPAWILVRERACVQ